MDITGMYMGMYMDTSGKYVHGHVHGLTDLYVPIIIIHTNWFQIGSNCILII